MNIENKEDFCRAVAEGLARLEEVSGANISSADAVKMVRKVLSTYGMDDEVSTVSRKLKSGHKRSFVKVGSWVIDIKCLEQPFSEEESDHPLVDDFKGRGRNPIVESDGLEMADELNCAHVIRALTYAGKRPTAFHRDSMQSFIVKLKDVRGYIAKLGVKVTAREVKCFIDANMSEDIKFVEHGKTMCYEISTGVTLGEWIESRKTASELVEDLYKKYVKSAKATG